MPHEGTPTRYHLQGSLTVMLRDTRLVKELKAIGYDPNGPLLPTEVLFGEILWHLIRRRTQLPLNLLQYAADYKRRADCHGAPDSSWNKNDYLELRNTAQSIGINIEKTIMDLEVEFAHQ